MVGPCKLEFRYPKGLSPPFMAIIYKSVFAPISNGEFFGVCFELHVQSILLIYRIY